MASDENANELNIQDDPEKLPENGSQERAMAEHRLVRKLDTRLLPTMILIYILNLIDVCPTNFDDCAITHANSVLLLWLRGWKECKKTFI